MADDLDADEKQLSLWQLEVLRLKKKGLWNCLLAALLYFPFFYFWYALEKYLWAAFQPQIMAVPQKLIATVGASLIHTAAAVLFLLLMLPTYTGRASWLDGYRVPVRISL